MVLFISVLLVLFFLALLGVSYWISNLLLYARRQPITRTPADCGLAFEDISFLSQDGLMLMGWWIPAPAKNQDAAIRVKGEEPVVIILHPHFGNRHGLCVQPRAWLPLFVTDVDLLKTAQTFHRAGYAVLLFDFRSHGESQRGLCTGGFTEDQDVMGAVNYVFRRVAADDNVVPAVGVVGFGLGATAALAAAGREKGGADVIRVFSGDSAGGSGFLEIKPSNVKHLRFLVAIQPASLGVLLRSAIRQVAGRFGLIVVPFVDRFCQWRGGYPLVATTLLRYVREIHIPVLYIQSRLDRWGNCSEIQSLYNATPDPKQIWWLEEPLGQLEIYKYIGEHWERVLAFASQYICRD